MIFRFLFIRNSFNEAEEISNKSLNERDEEEERVVSSLASKCSDETDDDRSVSKLIALESVSLHEMFIKWFVTFAHMSSRIAFEFHQIAFNKLQSLSLSFIFFFAVIILASKHRPWRRSCTPSIEVWRGKTIWHNSSSNLFAVSESVRHSNFSRLLYEHFHVASFKSLHRRLASRLDRQRCCCFWCMYAIWICCVLSS